MKPSTVLVLAFTLAAAQAAHAACHWAWYCDKSSTCGFVPYCDLPTDTPPPFVAVRPDDAAADKPVDPPVRQHGARQPLPGFKPISPPPARPAASRETSPN